MSNEYQDVGQFHKNDKTGKWRFQRLGYAKKNDKGGLDIYLDALPIPGPYGVRMVVTERQERPQTPQEMGYSGGKYDDDIGSALAGDIDDEVPFSPEWR